MSARRGEDDPSRTAKAIIDANLYMVLGTADGDGHPWVSPVYYAHSTYREFLWVSRPTTLHSLNLAVRAQVSIVIFDSSAPIGTGQGVYMGGTAEEITGGERAAAIEIFSRRSIEHGGREWAISDIESPAELRLYRATATSHYILGSIDRLIPADV